MKTARVLIHGFILGGVSVFAILVGYAAYRASGMPEQVVIQVLVAGFVCVAAFALIGWVAHRLSSGRLTIGSVKELGVTYITAFGWSAALFVPLHYATQGYLTSIGNLLGVWLFQFPFNLLALLVANGRLLMPQEAREESEYSDGGEDVGDGGKGDEGEDGGDSQDGEAEEQKTKRQEGEDE